MVAAAHAATRILEPESPWGDQHRRPSVTAAPLLPLVTASRDAMLTWVSAASAIGPGALSRMPAR
jgi:hypothetical protein